VILFIGVIHVDFMSKQKLPSKLTKGKSIFIKTTYNSYIPSDMDGMAAQKNALSYKQLIKLGYK